MICVPLAILTLAFAIAAMPAPALAQKKAFRLGYLTANSAAAEQSRIEQFRQGLRSLGYLEGQNLLIEFRFTDGKFERLPELAKELAQLPVDVLIANTTNAAQAAKKSGATVPMFFMGVSDPIEAGFVNSLAHPGGNMTGLTNIAPMLAGKRVELLKEVAPKISRIAILWDPKNPGSTPQWKESQVAAKEMGLQVHSMAVSRPEDYESAFKAASKAGSNALSTTLNPLANSNQKQVVALAAKHRLPAIYARGDYVQSGGLLSYGPSDGADGREAARLVDKLLKGTKPADIPVEQPTRFEFAINLKTAKSLNLHIPQSVLFRADKVIK